MHQSLWEHVYGIAAGCILSFNHLCSRLSKIYYHQNTEAIEYFNFTLWPDIMIMDIDFLHCGQINIQTLRDYLLWPEMPWVIVLDSIINKLV